MGITRLLVIWCLALSLTATKVYASSITAPAPPVTVDRTEAIPSPKNIADIHHSGSRLAWCGAFLRAASKDLFTFAVSPNPGKNIPIFFNTAKFFDAAKMEAPPFIPEYITLPSVESQTGVPGTLFSVYMPPTVADRIQVSVGSSPLWRSKWRDLALANKNKSKWELFFPKTHSGQKYWYRRLDPLDKKWKIFSDPNALEVPDEYDPAANLGKGGFADYAYIPTVNYQMKNKPVTPQRALVIYDGTLESLIGDFEGGEYAAKDSKDLDLVPLSIRIAHSGIPQALANRGFTAVQVPLSSSVVDLVNSDWRYHYLVRNANAFGRRLGNVSQVMEMIDAFAAAGIVVIWDVVQVHRVRDASYGSPDNIRDKDGRSPFVANGITPFIDFGTDYYPIEVPEIRQQRAESLAFLTWLLQLRFLRIDYTDGILSFPGDSGRLFLDTLTQTLQKYTPQAIRIVEAFQTQNLRETQALGHVMYDPGVGYNAIDELLKIPQTAEEARKVPDIQKFIQQVSAGYDGGPYKPGLRYAFDHDVIGKDPRVSNKHPANSVGQHAAQAAFNLAEALVRFGVINRSEMLDFARKRVAIIELAAMMSSRSAYMTTGRFQLGGYNDRDAWKFIWDVTRHPDISEMEAITGLEHSEVLRALQLQSDQAVKSEKLFNETTPVLWQQRKPVVSASVNHWHPDNLGVFSYLRPNPNEPHNSLLVVFNVGFQDFQSYEIPVPKDMKGKWQIVLDLDDSNSGDLQWKGGMIEPRSGAASGQPSIVDLHIRPHNAVVLKYVPNE